MVSTIIFNETCHIGSSPFETFSADDVGAMGEIIDDAADEIKFLVDVAQKQLNKLENRVRELEVGA